MASTDPPFPPVWRKSATVYEIYPHSFCDSNGDGIGDLNGIRSKLDHLQDLGVDVLWLCPIYRSPKADMGYDVSDYRDIDPQYGTMEDLEELVEAVHERGIKLIMDAIFNHTSNEVHVVFRISCYYSFHYIRRIYTAYHIEQASPRVLPQWFILNPTEHPWFLKSKSSKTNPKHDWYIWRRPRYINGIRLPPNNWADSAKGPAWGYVPERGEYFLHGFSKHQPDLNWKNPDVRAAVVDVMKFWLDKGIDGFRLDAINFISKPNDFSDAPITYRTQYYQFIQDKFVNGPHVHEYLKELCENVLSGRDETTVGELGYTFEPAVIAEYILPGNKELNQAFSFELMVLDMVLETPLMVRPVEYGDIQEVVEKWQTYRREDGFWNAALMENHDFGRSITRFANDSPQWRALSAKMFATLLVTQTGTLYLYQGQEIGMKNIPRAWGIEEYKDERTQLYWDMMKKKRQTESGEEDPYMEDLLDDIQILARDNARIPMQWDTTKNAGFTTGTPWMRASEDDARDGWNALDESKDPNSVLSFWKRALQTRKQHDILVYGSFEPRAQADLRVFTYVRKLGNKTAWVALNLSPDGTELSLKATDGLGIPHGDDVHATVLPELVLSNYADPPGLTGDSIALRAYESVVFVK